MTAIRPICFALPLLLLLAGCATPARRIQQNQELFDSFPVAAQARIRGGQIDLGFTPEMVRIAFGEPQRKLVRRTPGIEAEIWFYVDTLRSYERQRAELDGLSLAGPGGIRTVSGSAWVNILQEREVVRSRVEFQNGVVVAIEEPAKDPSPP
jgi:hypothetical protein